MLREVSKRFSRVNSILLILAGTISWSVTMVKSGIAYAFGLGFWGANGHDGIWHLALSESLARGSLNMPVFAGSRLQNYHIGFDLILAVINKFSGISITALYFQIFPIAIAFLTGFLTYKLVSLWTRSQNKAWWSTFFVYFGGNLGWIIAFVRNRDFGGESMFWAQQSISTLINPPFAMSVVLILMGVIFLIKLKSKFTNFRFLICVLCFGVLSEIKIYASALVLGSLFLASLFEIYKERKFLILKIFIGSLIFSVAIFIPFNRNSASLLIFQPFWFLESMMGSSDRLNWVKYAEAMTTYRRVRVWSRMIPAYAFAFIIFWVGNMGTRFFKEFTIFKLVRHPKKISYLEVIFAVIIVGGGVAPMLFLQAGTAWNTIQFFYYSLVFSGILAGLGVVDVMERFGRRFRVGLGALVIIFTIPTTLGTLQYYLPSRPPAKLPIFEMQALDFLSRQKGGVVLTYPFDQEAAKKAEANPPRPLYLYDSTAYVSAFSKKDVFLEDEVNLNITGFDWRVRRSEVEKFLNTLDQNEARNFLKKNNISYVYWVKPQRARLGESQLGLTKIFENSEVTVYKVNDFTSSAYRVN